MKLFRFFPLALALVFALPAQATVTGSTTRNDYVAAGLPTFYFWFPVADKTWVQVQLATVVQGSGYTVLLNANQTTAPGGTVTFLAAPANGVAVRIQRVAPLTQGVHYSAYSAFPAATHEAALDKATMLVQQVDRDRSDLAATHAADKTTQTARDAGQDSLHAADKATQTVRDAGQDSTWANNIAALNGTSHAATDLSSVLALGSTTPRTLTARFSDVVNVRDFGAKDDGITDCWPALQQAAAAVGYSGTVKFSGTASSVYYLSFLWPNAVAGITFDVDPGVVLSENGGESLNASTPRIKFTRPTKLYFRTLKNYFVTSASASASSNGALPAPTKDIWLDDASFNRSKMYPVYPNTAEITALKLPWPSSDAWVADGFATYSSSSWRSTPGVADGALHLGMRNVLPGDELIGAMHLLAGSPKVAAVVRTTGGMYGIYASSDPDGTQIMYLEKTTGVTGVATALHPPWQGTHRSYSPIYSVWSIRIDAWNRGTILLNGIGIATFKTAGYIYQAGFGLLPSTAGDSVDFQDIVVARHKPPTGGGFVSIRVFGDSRAAPRTDCWPDFLKTAMEFTAGIRAWKIDNQAISGDSSPQAWAKMQAVGVSDVDVVVIDIGTNDAQNFMPVDGAGGFLDNITRMVSMAQAAGKMVVLVNFDLWYTQLQAGVGVGQLSTNYDAGALYRSAIIRLAATTDVKLVDSPSLAGPIMANYINPSIGIDLTKAGDEMVVDSIHPTAMANRLRAREIAKAVAGLVFPAAGSMALSGIPLVPSGGWAASLGGAPLTANIDAVGNVTFDGFINDPGGATRAGGTIVLTIPAFLRPVRGKVFKVYSEITTEQAFVNIDQATGQVTIYNVPTSGYFSLSSVSYNIDTRPGY